ncbi:MAG: hypothetical protein LBJ90_01510 [Treponema sp.]|jgi:hypothetical protein|nr:hypothetical protein [Treponema sp.]
MEDTALAVVAQPRELSVIEVKNQVTKIQGLMTDLMKEGTHFGKSFPGDTKKNLLKPGADKLCFMFRLRPDFVQEIKTLSNDHMEVLTRCSIYHIESGQKIAEGVGLATTMESKYRWRNAAKKCPACGQETIIKGKAEYGGGWICYGKKGGCGAKFLDGDAEIENQPVGKIENPDIADTYNTVIKMSKKRAYVDATITSCAASDIFTQDLEDLEPEKLPNKEADEKTVPEPEPEKNSKIDPLILKRTELKEKIISIMIARDPDEFDYFSNEEKQSVKNILQRTGRHEAGMAIVEGLVSKWGEELEKRKAAYKPVPFDDDPLPAMYSEPEGEEAAEDRLNAEIF